MTTSVRLRTAEAMATMLYARFLVRFMPFERWRGRLGTPLDPGSQRSEGAKLPVNSDVEAVVRQCSAAVRRAAFRLPGSLCLPQAITLQKMLTRRGIPSIVVIGYLPANLRGQGDDLHAWVEWSGQIVLGDSGGNHATLLKFVSQPALANCNRRES